MVNCNTKGAQNRARQETPDPPGALRFPDYTEPLPAYRQPWPLAPLESPSSARVLQRDIFRTTTVTQIGWRGALRQSRAAAPGSPGA